MAACVATFVEPLYAVIVALCPTPIPRVNLKTFPTYAPSLALALLDKIVVVASPPLVHVLPVTPVHSTSVGSLRHSQCFAFPGAGSSPKTSSLQVIGLDD